MQKFAFLFIAILATVVTVVRMGNSRKPGISGGGSTIAPTALVLLSPTAAETVPLPTGADVIRTFIQLIHEGKIPDAIGMMDDTLITSDSDKQQYGVIFNSFASIATQRIESESFGKENVEKGEERYRVEIDIALKPQSQHGMWDEGVNTRWITVKKQGDRFLIHDIATGP